MTTTRTILPSFLLLMIIVLSACSSSSTLRTGAAASDMPNQSWLTHATSVHPMRSLQEPNGNAAPQDRSAAQDPQVETKPEAESSRPFLIGALLYLPNRIFDLLDIARVRARVGPGLSLGARVTRPLNLAIGAHEALFVGLHGPRGEASIPWPLGLENFAGAEVSVINGLRAGNVFYGLGEIGAGTQLLILGAEVGVDPWELVDFVVGFVTADPVEDDF